MRYTKNQAEVVAIKALGWLSAQDDLMMTFLGATGSGLDDVRERAGDADFLASVMDFILMDDNWVRGFCDEQSLPYDAPQHLRMALPGGSLPNWT
ncbi:MAG: DUF3572 domain-containing protein [Proteobacteria bacterium]|nr:DUF3572 domain-containing protein [Pseudomonadota bacterium]